MLTLADHIPLLIRMLPEEMRSTAHEIDRYFNNTDDARQIRDLLKQTLRPCWSNRMMLLIGTVSVPSSPTIPCGSRRARRAERQSGLLDAGHPMGMHYIQRRLLGMNGSVEKLSRPDPPLGKSGSRGRRHRAQSKVERELRHAETGSGRVHEDHCHGYTTSSSAMKASIAIVPWLPGQSRGGASLQTGGSIDVVWMKRRRREHFLDVL